jgi:hypothetical protein
MPRKQQLAPSYAWVATQPLGLHEPSAIDTLLYNYCQQSIPALTSDAYATTGNLGASGINNIYFQRPERTEFMFTDVLEPWLYTPEKQVYYPNSDDIAFLQFRRR